MAKLVPYLREALENAPTSISLKFQNGYSIMQLLDILPTTVIIKVSDADDTSKGYIARVMGFGLEVVDKKGVYLGVATQSRNFTRI